MIDISNEAWREYDFDDGTVYRIDNPSTLVEEGSETRIVDFFEVTHVLPTKYWHVIRKAMK